jgi:hypothetical protein
MPKLTLRLSAGLLTFLIGVASASVWLTSRRHSATNNRGGSAPEAPNHDMVKRTYRDVDHVSVGLRVGVYGASVSTVESSDGRVFTSVIAVLPSDKRAQWGMDRILRSASEVIKREPLFDEKGVRVGEKAVATFAGHAEPLVGSAQLLWTRGAEFSRVGSSSLQNVLAYERDYGW